MGPRPLPHLLYHQFKCSETTLTRTCAGERVLSNHIHVGAIYSNRRGKIMFLRPENSSLNFFTLPPIFLLINFTILVVNGKKIVTTRTKKKQKIDLEILPSLLARTSKAVTSGSLLAMRWPTNDSSSFKQRFSISSLVRTSQPDQSGGQASLPYRYSFGPSRNPPHRRTGTRDESLRTSAWL